MSPRTAYVIDPDRNSRDLMSRFLADSDFKTLDFADAGHGLTACTEEPPSVVIAEVFGLPVDGFAVCRGIRQSEAAASTAVVLVSFLEAEDRAQEVEADSFLLKPLEPASFLATIEAAIARRQPNGEKR